MRKHGNCITATGSTNKSQACDLGYGEAGLLGTCIWKGAVWFALTTFSLAQKTNVFRLKLSWKAVPWRPEAQPLEGSGPWVSFEDRIKTSFIFDWDSRLDLCHPTITDIGNYLKYQSRQHKFVMQTWNYPTKPQSVQDMCVLEKIPGLQFFEPR